MLFIKHDSTADGVEHAASDLKMVLSCMRPAANCCHPASHCRWCVWHGSNYRHFIELAAGCGELLLPRARLHGSRNGYKQSLCANFESDLPQHLRHSLGLYGQQDDVGTPDSFAIIGAYRNTQFTRERSCPFRMPYCRGNAIRLKQSLL